MDDREQRGLALAALYRIEREGDKWLVPSQKGDGTSYVVEVVANRPRCTCPDNADRGVKCKHLFAVEFVQAREPKAEGAATVTQTLTITQTLKVKERPTYKQDWPNYNRAQTREKRLFMSILADLCRGIAEPVTKGPGRKPLKLADLTYACAFKVYCALSARRFASDLDDAAEKGYVSRAAHFNVVIKHMDDPKLTPVLKALLIEAARPLAAVETSFAVDSSGFSTSRFAKWFDHKYGKTVQEREWVKAHLVCGVKTNVVTAVEVMDKDSADCPQLPALLKTTRRNFDVKEVSADAAYLSQENMEAVAESGGTPYIAFKENTTGGVGGLFAKMFHYYCLNKDDFLAHYHKRSNVESTFSMVKGKFRDHVRSKSDAGMVNEVLCKFLCHNICCLIQSTFELGIQAKFWSKAEITEPGPEAEPVGAGIGDDVDAWAWI